VLLLLLPILIRVFYVAVGFLQLLLMLDSAVLCRQCSRSWWIADALHWFRRSLGFTLVHNGAARCCCCSFATG